MSKTDRASTEDSLSIAVVILALLHRRLNSLLGTHPERLQIISLGDLLEMPVNPSSSVMSLLLSTVNLDNDVPMTLSKCSIKFVI